MYEGKNGPRTARDNSLQAGQKRTFSYKSLRSYFAFKHEHLRLARLNLNVAQSSRRITAFT